MHLRTASYRALGSGLALFVGSLALGGCTGAPPYVPPEKPGDAVGLAPDPEPEGLVAWHDQGQQILPMPSDLWMAGGVIVRPPVEDRSPAESALFDQLAGRDGWPIQSAIYFPLSSRLADTTSGADVRLFDVERQEAVSIDLELEEQGLRLVPTTPLRRSSHYVYALLRTAEGPDGEALKPHPEFSALLSDEVLEDREQEALRLTYGPWLVALEQRGVARSEIAMVGAFTTTSQPGPRFGPRFGDHSLPSDFLRDETGALALPSGTVDALLATRLDEYDGFSTSAPAHFAASAPIDPEGPLDAEGLRLLHNNGGTVQTLEATYPMYIDGDTYAVAPEVAFPSAAELVLVARGPMTSAGTPLQTGLPSLVLLMEESLLLDTASGTQSAVRILPLVDASLLEPVREALTPVRDALRAEPEGLENVLHLQPFTTLDARGVARERRQRLYDEQVPTAPSALEVATPFSRGLWLLMPNVQTIVSGTLPTQDWIDPETRADRLEGPAPRDIHFVLTLPENVPEGESVPVVLFGHGLMTTRELVYVVADGLAEQGFASFAIDFPFHGERSVCLSDNNCPGDSRCSLYGQCLDDAGDVVEIGAIESWWPNGPRIPPTTGEGFIELDNLMASRDHILQAQLDLSQAVRVIRDEDWADHGPIALDGDDIVYLGISLGGIVGASLAGVEEHIDTYALNVPGAGLIELMQDSTILGPSLGTFLEERGLTPGTPDFHRFEGDAKWALNPSDPLNLAPRPGSTKRLLIQMAQGDIVVPNDATLRLSRATGVPISVYTPALLGHGFLGDPTNLESGAARAEILEFYANR